ncbi:hypothetical protein C5167_020221 [Papaver somniferum]|uniref:Uncharacterized protein n=1 Tax=Papaver somniferum TaxID=3469 RepID=A0A4Y7IWL0_PAPSO|nr:hypothetical protein C5167_020221 [Papaver somniferum]
MDQGSSCGSNSNCKSWIMYGLVTGAAIAAAAIGAAFSIRGSGKFRSGVIGIIPARYAFSRFEALYSSYSWETHDLENMGESKTSLDTGPCTERCNEALEKLERKYDIIVHIQVDEPLIEPGIIDGIVKALQGEMYCRQPWLCNLFFEGLIPFNKSGKVNPNSPYLLHLGIQSYDSKFLKKYSELAPTPLQLEEDLEQLKVLENGYKMKVLLDIDPVFPSSISVLAYIRSVFFSLGLCCLVWFINEAENSSST